MTTTGRLNAFPSLIVIPNRDLQSIFLFSTLDYDYDSRRGERIGIPSPRLRLKRILAVILLSILDHDYDHDRGFERPPFSHCDSQVDHGDEKECAHPAERDSSHPTVPCGGR